MGLLDPPALAVRPAFVNALGADSAVVGDGVADDRAALLARATSAATLGVSLLLPARVYRVASGLNFPANLRIAAEPGAVMKGTLNSAALATVGSGTRIGGLTFENDGTGICLAVRTGATDVDIQDCRFVAGVQGISIADTGISNIRIDQCAFTSGLGYGILTNVAANDLSNLKVTDCDFLECSLDPIEFNHPSAGVSTARNFLVQGCYFSQSADTGTSPSSGFGIGAAGVSGLRVENNTFDRARLQAVHVEDDCSDVIILGNTIRNCGDTDQTAVSQCIWVTSSVGVLINANNISGTNVGGGIYVVYNGGTGVSELIVADNRITGCADDAIVVAGDGPGIISVTGNVVTGNSADGIYLRANTPNISATGNTVVGNGGWGIRQGRPGTVQARIVHGNLVTGNTLGDYDGAFSTAGEEIHLSDRQCWSPGVSWAATGTTAFPLMRVGGYATGTVRIAVRAIDGSMITSQLWRVTWDGSALTADPLKVSSTGPVTASTLSVINGALAVNLTNSGGLKTATVWADFAGDILEDNAARTGTVAGIPS